MAEDGLSDEEEESGGMAARLDDLTIETVWTEEEAAEQLEDMLEMEVKEEGKVE